MSNTEVETEKADNIKNNEEVEEEEEDDVPEDFFDDFLKNDFLAGLEVLDDDECPASVINKLNEENREVAFDSAAEDVGEKRSISRERVFKKSSDECISSESSAKRPAKERLGIRVIEDIALNKNDDRKDDDKKRSKSAEREKRRERGRSKDKLRKSGEKDDSSKDERDRRRRSGERKRKSASPERRRRSRSRHRSGSKERRESGNTRRDPSKTMRDIQRDKVKCAKDKEAKIISEKLKIVETGLCPPGMEMEMNLVELTQPKRSRSRSLEAYRSKRRSDKESTEKTKLRKRSRSRSIETYRRGRYPEKSPSPKTRRRYRSPSPVRREEYRSRYRRSPLMDRRSEDRKWERPSKERKPTFLEELDEKLNHQASYLKLEKIKEKINGGPIYQKHSVPLASPVPPVIGHSAPCFPPVYDEQFFIGQQPPPPAIQQHMYPVQAPPPNYNSEPHSSVDTLFNDENISLSAFLSITARATDNSKTMDLQEKVKVISRCQDAIKLMTETSKQSGRFIYKGVMKASEKNVDFTNMSPMKRVLPVRLNYTKRAKKPEEKPGTPLELLLYKLGLKQPAKKSAVNVPKPSENMTNNYTQTKSFTCCECEARKKVKTVSMGVQCVKSSSDFSCQVSEDDFLNTARSALKNILKNQSLAALTPAQLMSQLGGEKEVFPAARKLNDPMEMNPIGPEGIGYNRNHPIQHGPMMDYNRRQQMPPPLMQMQMPAQPSPQPIPYPQGGFHPHQQNPQFRPYYDQQNQFNRY